MLCFKSGKNFRSYIDPKNIFTWFFLINNYFFQFFWPKGLLNGPSFDKLISIVEETIRKRRNEGIVRHDMVHILLEASEKAKKQKEELARESEFKLGEIIGNY